MGLPRADAAVDTTADPDLPPVLAGSDAGVDDAGEGSPGADKAGADLVVYSTSWCPFCLRLLTDLDAAGVSYREVDVDHDQDAAALVMEINRGNRVVPTVVFADGSSMTNPAVGEVTRRLAALR